ncbi:MAG: hypothetical protein HY401_06425 [Elusimicrobia bacterium]|nr:hypothetical protein [Elusimicrobiota bacterium]
MKKFFLFSSIALLMSALGAGVIFAGYSARNEGGRTGLSPVRDGFGNTVSILNRFDGRKSYIQIAKYDPNGNTLCNTYHPSDFSEEANSLSVDSMGNIYVAGFRESRDGRHALAFKYSSTCEPRWEFTDEYHQCMALDIVYDANGNSWVGGSCAIGNTNPAKLIKLNPNGRRLWDSLYDGGGKNYVVGLSPDYGNNVSMTVQVVPAGYSGGYSFEKTVAFNNQGARVAAF